MRETAAVAPLLPGDRRFSLAVALLGALLLLAATARFGIGVSPDSTVYFSAAESSSAGRGLVQFDGAPLVHWAPLYPAILSLPARLGIPPTQSARILNLVCYGCFLYLSGVWLARHVRSRPWARMALVAVLLSTTVLRDFLYAWSEPLFLVLVLLFLMDAESWLIAGSRSALLRAALWATLGSLVRYPGVTLGLSGMVLCLPWPGIRERRPGRERIAAALVFAASLVPLALWLARNLSLSGEALGERATSRYSAAESVFFVLDGASRMFLPANLPAGVRVGILTGVAAVLGVFVLRRSAPPPRGAGAGDLERLRLAPAACLASVYVATLILWTASQAVEPADAERYLSPLYVIVAAGAALALRLLVSWPPGEGAAAGTTRWQVRRLSVAWSAVLLAACFMTLVFPALRTARHLARSFREGVAGYTNAQWRASPLAAALRARPLRGVVFSNAPDAVAYLARHPARLVPRKAYDDPPRPGGGLDFGRYLATSRAAYLVWFTSVDRPVLYSLDDMKRVSRVAVLDRRADGAIYRMRPAGRSTSERRSPSGSEEKAGQK